MDDRELLEAAARAIGKAGEYDEYWDGFKSPVTSGEMADEAIDGVAGYTFWNPLTDDGDALRLAVKLRMVVSLADCCCCAMVSWDGNEEDSEIYVRFSPDFPDRERIDAAAATRLAIVRAAAALSPQPAPEER